MNRIHRTIWSALHRTFVVVSEATRSMGKTPGGAVATTSLLAVLGLPSVPALAGATADALPTGGSVTAGQATIVRDGQAMTITQSSARAAIDWQKFSVGSGASVTFSQPDARAVVLNRVTGQEASVIDGALRANGQVFLVNPNGVLFGKDAQVDTAGLLASTRALGTDEFMAGRLTLSGSGDGSVVNDGRIDAKDGGYVVLVGQQVRNDGVVSARLGHVVLGAGNKVTLGLDGHSLVNVVVEQGAIDSLVANGGAIMADGGQVLLAAKAASGLLDGAVNQTGEIRARSLGEREGRIVLLGDMDRGSVVVGGTLDVTAPSGGNGGFIETSAHQVRVQPSARVETYALTGLSGTWLIDPTDFIISDGSGAQTTSGIGAQTLEAALASGNVTIQTQSSGSEAGDIHVDAPVSWSAHQLRLEAHGDIDVNAVMTATGTSSLKLRTGYDFNLVSPSYDRGKALRMGMGVDAQGRTVFTGRIDFDRSGAGLLSINDEDYTLLDSLGSGPGDTTGTTLQGINGALTGHFALADHIDASATSGWGGGAGFAPIGSSGSAFSGVFNGLGHTVSNLTVDSTTAHSGLIAEVSNAVPSGDTSVRNVGLVDFSSTCTWGSGCGGLVGKLSNFSTLADSYVSGTISATGSLLAAGLGVARTDANTAYVHDVRATGSISGTTMTNVGGLVGEIPQLAELSKVSARVDISASSGATGVGGLIGSMNGGVLQSSYSAGQITVSGNGYRVGGLVGSLDGSPSSDLSDVFSLSAVTVAGQADDTGGLVGSMTGASSLSRGYAAGPMSVGTVGLGVGGLVGSNFGGTSNGSFWDSDATGRPSSALGSPMTTAQMMAQANFESSTSANGGVSPGFDFAGGTWRIYEGLSYPLLRAFLTPLTATATNMNAVYGSALPALSVTYSQPPASSLLLGTASAQPPSMNAGTYAVPISGLYSTAWGYDIASDPVTVTIAPAPVTVLASGTRPYDGTAVIDSSRLTVVNAIGSDDVGVQGLAGLAGASAGVHALTSLGSLTLTGTSASNYTLVSSTPTGTITITPRPLDIAALRGATRTYDGTTDADSHLLRMSNVILGDQVALAGTATLSSSHAGINALSSAAGLVLVGSDASNYTLLGGSLTGQVTITARPISITAAPGATRVYDGGTSVAAALLSVSNVLPGDDAGLTGSAALASRVVGSQPLTAGTLAVTNRDYTLPYGAVTGSVDVTPRVLQLTITAQDKAFDGTPFITTRSTSDQVAGDEVDARYHAILADAELGRAKPVLVDHLALYGADAGNYQLVSNAANVTANVSTRVVTYELASSGIRPRYIENGLTLVNASDLDRLVVASFADTVPGTGVGALSYTIWKDGAQVQEIASAGRYEVRAAFAAQDPHYELAGWGNKDLIVEVQAALGEPFDHVIAEAARTTSPSKPPSWLGTGIEPPPPFPAGMAVVAQAPRRVMAAVGQNIPLALLSAPSPEEDSEEVTMELARRMMTKPGSDSATEPGRTPVRTPIDRRSLVSLIDGGVKLPEGLEQTLFVVKAVP